jgi:hypothetical protein
MTALMQAYFNEEKPIVLDTNASWCASAGVLSQYEAHGILHPVFIIYNHHFHAASHYEIYNSESDTGAEFFEQWRPECEG